MRALAAGLTFLAIAALVPSWDAAERRARVPIDPGHVAPDAPVPSPASQATGAHPPGRAGARVLQGSPPGVIASPATRGEDTERAARASDRAAGSIGEPEKLEKRPVAAPREPTPGSKDDPGANLSFGPEESADAMASVARLYFAYFNRAPDFEGFNHYIDQRQDGRPLEVIAEEFAGSREFELRYGSADNATFIDRVHRNVVGAPADPAQHAFWLAQLDSGTMTRGELMLVFSESAPYLALVADEVFVTMAYAETLRRAPAPGELLHWVSFLDAGNPRVALIDQLRGRSPPR